MKRWRMQPKCVFINSFARASSKQNLKLATTGTRTCRSSQPSWESNRINLWSVEPTTQWIQDSQPLTCSTGTPNPKHSFLLFFPHSLVFRLIIFEFLRERRRNTTEDKKNFWETVFGNKCSVNFWTLESKCWPFLWMSFPHLNPPLNLLEVVCTFTAVYYEYSTNCEYPWHNLGATPTHTTLPFFPRDHNWTKMSHFMLWLRSLPPQWLSYGCFSLIHVYSGISTRGIWSLSKRPSGQT